MDNVIKHRFLLLLFISFNLFLLTQCQVFSEIQVQRKIVREKLIDLSNSLPKHFALNYLSSTEIIKPELGTITNTYNTKAECKLIESFYFNFLTNQGWKPTKENSLYYYKDKYVIGIVCKNNSSSEQKYVQISYIWDEKEILKNTF